MGVLEAAQPLIPILVIIRLSTPSKAVTDQRSEGAQVFSACLLSGWPCAVPTQYKPLAHDLSPPPQAKSSSAPHPLGFLRHGNLIGVCLRPTNAHTPHAQAHLEEERRGPRC
jgi:hypothetical protein